MDNGETKLNFNSERNTVEISIRAPLAIHPVTAEIPAVQVLEFAAMITLQSIQRSREIMTDLTAGVRPQ